MTKKTTHRTQDRKPNAQGSLAATVLQGETVQERMDRPGWCLPERKAHDGNRDSMLRQPAFAGLNNMTQTRKDRIGSPPEAIDADVTIMDDVQDMFHSVYGRVTYLEWCHKEAQRIGAKVRQVGEWCCVTSL